MRTGLSTPSFDSLEPPWTEQRNQPDGSFLEFGLQYVSKKESRVTYVLTSELPRSLVSIVGRSLKPKRRTADFLTIRIGANTPKYFRLLPDQTWSIHVGAEGAILSSKVQVTRDEFVKRWVEVISRINCNELKVSPGMLAFPG